MTESPSDQLERLIDGWVADPESDVVYAEKVEERWAVRMQQQIRESTTVWFEVGPRSVRYEAYVLPGPLSVDGYRLCLQRNASSWRAFFAVDREGALVLRGRLSVERVTDAELDHALAEIYELVEVTFRSLVREKIP